MEPIILIKTTQGNIKIKLYNETPLHRDNFLKNIESGDIQETLFHRVISGFMIQGGDPESKKPDAGARLGMGTLTDDQGKDYRIPAEFHSHLYHKRGALAAARDGNSQKASSNCQFYIVDGQIESEALLQNKGYTEEQIKTYTEVGGTSFLDQDYTVFGEVLEGLDVVSTIANMPKDRSDRPREDVRMTFEILEA